MMHLLKKYRYFVVSFLLHFSILCFIFYGSLSNTKYKDIAFNIEGSKQKSQLKVSILSEKAKKEVSVNKLDNIYTSNDEEYVESIIEDQSLLKVKPPKYPKRAILNNQEGEVIVRLLVEKTGEIKKIVIHKSSKYLLLDNAVLDAAKYWNIKRSLNDISWVQVKVNFVIQ